jgi:hypothetical protein
VLASRRLPRLLLAGPIGALIALGLSVVPATTAQALVVHHTKAGEVTGPIDRSEVRALPFPARHVALYWSGNPDAQLAVAFSTDAVHFGASSAVEEDEVGMQLHNGQSYGAVMPAGNATFARVTSDRPLGRLTVLALAEDGTTVEKAPVPKNQAGAAEAVNPRSAWGADESLRFKGTTETWPPVFQAVQKLVVHHTAGANGETGETAKATIRSIYYYHAVTQGWGDIGYNFLIDAAGTIYKGRSTSTSQADDGNVTGENASAQGVTAGHAYGYNSGTVGVALLGNFVDTLPTQLAQDSLKGFLLSKVNAHGLNAAQQSLYTNPVNGTQDTFENLPGHSQVPNNATECPGAMFLNDVFRFMRSDLAKVQSPPDTVAPSPPSKLTATVSKRSVQLKWAASSGDSGIAGAGTSGVAGYDVYRWSPGAAPTRLTSTTALTYTDTTSGPRTVYTYTVMTFDGAANRSIGLTVLATA